MTTGEATAAANVGQRLDVELPLVTTGHDDDCVKFLEHGSQFRECSFADDSLQCAQTCPDGPTRCDSIRSDSSISTSSQQPQCRICHLPSSGGNTLLSPCRCSGTLRFVHKSCLVHWLEVSAKKVVSSPHCELCGYNYRTHRCLSFKTAQVPHCSRQDSLLHLLFVATMFIMICTAFISILYLSYDSNVRGRTLLNRQDVTVISCSLLFFVAFFIAVFTQYRAETSLCCLFARCWLINRHWRVKDYESAQDSCCPKAAEELETALVA